jgi:hypothetical protein
MGVEHDVDVLEDAGAHHVGLAAEKLLGNAGQIISVPESFSRSISSLTASAATMLTAWPEL